MAAEEVERSDGLRWPTRSAWVAFGIVAVLRAVPFIFSRISVPEEGKAYLPVGYVAEDLLAYVALVRQPPVPHSPFLANPFTTDPQDGRFVLLFHQLLAAVHRVTGVDAFWLLELSRPLLLVAFLLAFWRLVHEILPGDRERTWACWLVALSGGFGALGALVEPWLSGSLAATVRHDLWTAQGWNTFDAFYNPLWIAGLTLLLLLFGTVLRPGGLRRARDRVLAPVLLALLWLTHPYSALAGLAVILASPLVEWVAAGRVAWRPHLARWSALAPGVIFVAVVVGWQRQDAVFRTSSSNALGEESLGAFWYPLTLGAVGVLAVRGFVQWVRTGHSWRHALGGWVAAIVLLHPSTVLNGYHFVMYLYPALCIVAAPVAAGAFDRARRSPRPRLTAGALAAIVFAAPLAVTAADVRALSRNLFPTSTLALVNHVAGLPPGNVLASPDIGNLVPAYGPHRVYVGQWFMTPDFEKRAEWYGKLVRGAPDAVASLPALLENERIAYIVVPASAAAGLAPWLAPRVSAVTAFGTWRLLSLGPVPQ